MAPTPDNKPNKGNDDASDGGGGGGGGSTAGGGGNGKKQQPQQQSTRDSDRSNNDNVDGNGNARGGNAKGNVKGDGNGTGNNNGNDNGNGNNKGNQGNKKSKDSSDSSRSSGKGKDGHKSRNPESSFLPAGISSSSSSDNSSNDMTAIIGVLVGVGVLIIVIVAILVVCCRRGKKKKPLPEPMRYYGNNPDPKAQRSPYNSNWYSGSETGSSGVMPPPGGWAMPPPPPHMMSSDMSGGYSSGPAGSPVPPPNPGITLGFSKSTFTYDELAAATQGFSQANVLGQGGFGFVHKGVLPNGKEVAVKSLKSGSGQGEREFQAEVEIISRVHHKHLVSLVGYCIAGGQRMLVYEFVPNKTLEHHLHGRGQPVMDFETRHKIALGSAKGLAYLHEDCHPRIIHRDIKTANILIDYSFEAKVADFGLAKLSSDNYTHVSTRVMGTFGYLAPEYAASGKLTDRSDVFSNGVMLLELITGRRPIDPTGDEDTLVDWARPQLMRVLEEGKFEGLVDPRLENNFNPNEMTRMVACAAASIRHSAKRRPKMSQIVRALEGDMSLDALNGEGVKPGQSTYFGTGGGGSNDYDASSYQQDMKKFMSTLNEEDYTSSEYESSQDYGRFGPGFSGDSFGMRPGGGGNKNYM